MPPLAQHTSARAEHGTPEAVVELARTTLGRIDVDPASFEKVEGVDLWDPMKEVRYNPAAIREKWLQYAELVGKRVEVVDLLDRFNRENF